MTEQGVGAAGELRDLFSMLWRRKWVLLLVIGLIMAAVIAMTARQVKRYEASAQVIVAISDSAAIFDSPAQGRLQYERDLANELEFIRGDALQLALREELGFVPNLEVESTAGDVFTFTIGGANPARLAEVANSAAQVYVRERNDRIVQEFLTTTESVQRQIDLLTEEEQQLLAPIEAFRASLDPFETDSVGNLVNTALEIEEYEEQLRQLEEESAEDLSAVTTSRGQLRRTLDELQLSSNLQSGSARISRQAQIPRSPVSPSWPTNLVLGALAASICALGAALTLEFSDTRIRSKQDIGKLIGSEIPILAIPTAPKLPRAERRKKGSAGELVLNSAPSSDAAQSFWELNGMIVSHDPDTTNRWLIVTSAEPVAGKTFVAANLALTSARSHEATLLVDVDLRRPRMHKVFDVANKGGVSAFAYTGRIDSEECDDNLAIQVAGRLSGNPVELATRIESGDQPDDWFSSGLVVFDSPPVLAAPESTIWASMCDLAIFVARSGQTKRSDFADGFRKIQETGIPTFVVLTDQKSSRSDYKYAYKYKEPKRKKSRLPWRRSG